MRQVAKEETVCGSNVLSEVSKLLRESHGLPQELSALSLALAEPPRTATLLQQTASIRVP